MGLWWIQNDNWFHNMRKCERVQFICCWTLANRQITEVTLDDLYWLVYLMFVQYTRHLCQLTHFPVVSQIIMRTALAIKRNNGGGGGGGVGVGVGGGGWGWGWGGGGSCTRSLGHGKPEWIIQLHARTIWSFVLLSVCYAYGSNQSHFAICSIVFDSFNTAGAENKGFKHMSNMMICLF